MKNTLKIASLTLLFAAAAAVGMEPNVDPSIDVFMINEAQWLGQKYTVEVKIQSDLRYVKLPFGPKNQVKLAYGEQDNIGKLKQINDILIGGVSYKNKLDEIKGEASGYPSSSKVYLHVTAGTLGYYVTWHWAEEPAAEQAKPDLRLISSKILKELDDIKKGSLGTVYAQKVTEICNADYTKAVAAGYSDLCQQLKVRLGVFILKGAPEGIKTREDAIKRIIDGLYAQLQMYKGPVEPTTGRRATNYFE